MSKPNQPRSGAAAPAAAKPAAPPPAPAAPSREPGEDDGPAAPASAMAPAPKGGALVVGPYGGELSGAGLENTTQADFAIPFLMVLQAMSPQCTKGKPEFIEAARPGMFINTVSNELYDGDKGVLIVPVTTAHVYTEWVPRDKGGGFKGVHLPESEYVRKAKQASGLSIGRIPVKSTVPNTPDTELVETFQIYAMLLDGPDATEASALVIVPFTSTKIKPYRNQMTQLRTVKGNPPLFAHRVRITTVSETNNKGTFFNVVMSPATKDIATSMLPAPADPGNRDSWHPLLKAGKAFHELVSSGAAKAAYDSVKDGASDAGPADGRDPNSPF